MFNKKLLNKGKLIAGFLLCTLAVLSTPATALETYAADGSDVSVCAEIIEWHYKIEDGKMYKALYNYSQGRYITDWEYVCDYPPTE